MNRTDIKQEVDVLAMLLKFCGAAAVSLGEAAFYVYVGTRILRALGIAP